MSETIVELVDKYVLESGKALRVQKGGKPGVLFLPEKKFIPFSDLGFNTRQGFFRLSDAPGAPNEALPFEPSHAVVQGHVHIYEVGKPLRPGVDRYPDMNEYNYRSGHHILLMTASYLSDEEIHAVQHLPPRFAFTVQGDVLIFQFRFGSVFPWNDCGYSWHNLPEDDRILPPDMTGEMRAPLHFIAVEATNGIIAAQRMVTFSPTFTQRLHRAIRDQATSDPPSDFRQQADIIFARYNSNQLRKRAIASCTGGDCQDRESPF